ncbi:MAG: ABC transporter permease [Trueperaceae bacterium]
MTHSAKDGDTTMLTYSAKRLLWVIMVLLFSSIVTFLLIFASPGSPAAMLSPIRPGQEDMFPEIIAAIEEKYGLNKPIHVQYWRYVSNIAKGDLGESFYYKRPVSEVLFSKLPATILLAAAIMLVAILVGIPMGIIMAARNNTVVDRSLLTFGAVLISLPGFLLALILVYVVAFQWKLLPSSGLGSARHLILPALAGGLPTAVGYAIVLRTNMLTMFGEDYVRTAKAKGLRSRQVIFRHLIPNAILPVVTLASIDMATLLTGVVLLEQVFSWPGLGFVTLKAVQAKDIPVVMGSVLIAALLIGVGNLIADIIAARLDPRVRLDS